MSNSTNHSAAIVARATEAYQTVALYELWLSLDATRREAERLRSHAAAKAATARMLELEKELHDDER